MTRRKRLLAAALILLAPTLAVSVARQACAQGTAIAEPPSREGRVRPAARALLSRLDGLAPDEVWGIARELGELGRDAVPVLTAELEGADDTRKLVLGRALCLAGDVGLGRRTLLELTRDAGRPEVRVYAARALGEVQNASGLEDVRKGLRLILEVETDPLVNAAVADAILRVSRGWRRHAALTAGGAGSAILEARAEALTGLREIMDGDDIRAAREAALVLAENGYDFLAQERLREIAAEPTDAGRRARLILRGVRPDWVEMLDEVSRRISRGYVDAKKVDTKALFDAAAKGMASSLDDFSDYLDEDDVKSMDAKLKNFYEGIGAYVGMRDRFFTIISPMYDGPAYRVGLRSLDRVIEVDGVATRDLGFEKTVKRLKGPKGTTVRVKVMRRGWSEPHEFVIARQEIRIEKCLRQLLPGNVGYIKLIDFYDKADQDVRGAIRSLLAEGARAFVFDLRNNGGGFLTQAVAVADAFLPPEKAIVYTKGRREVAPQTSQFSSGPDELGGRPLVVLVNSGSASASEIVCGALKEWRRADLVGEKTFGKGSVQSVIPLRSTGMKTRLKMTIARYHLPSGVCIDKKGVEPDVAVKDDLIPPWESEEIARLGLYGKVDAFIRGLFREDPGLVRRLARGDGGDFNAYPGLRELVDGFKTRVSDGPLRLLARASVRRLVADDLGRQFVVDLQEDHVLRRGVYELLVRMDAAADLDDLPPACRKILDEFRREEPSAGAVPDAKAAD